MRRVHVYAIMEAFGDAGHEIVFATTDQAEAERVWFRDIRERLELETQDLDELDAAWVEYMDHTDEDQMWWQEFDVMMPEEE
jgi:hypothetical protein